ncbi:centromere protein M isoform X1 [Tachysurus vachellii]|uniref:centromere protein M isoform X1 n=1 Tax=Tachysurus vachellii TaxID=175792 RepID=UPI00296AD64C|nr:centromere protein M isoform X1 [Tachysurus vachellii]
MALLTPYSKIPEPNTATILVSIELKCVVFLFVYTLCSLLASSFISVLFCQLVENEEKFQSKLADAIVQREQDANVNVRLACKLPVENSETRPRVDLVVFIVNLLSERSLQVVENSLNHLRSDFFLGKVCFMVTDARCGALAQERLISVKKLAASHRCPVICAEHQTEDGVSMAASRLLTILKVSAGLSPVATTALYLSTLTRCTVPSELDED